MNCACENRNARVHVQINREPNNVQVHVFTGSIVLHVRTLATSRLAIIIRK